MSSRVLTVGSLARRVRFLRLSTIRQEFGAASEVLGTYPKQLEVAFDKNYITSDLVINWVAEGVVLCFIHAIVGKEGGLSGFSLWHSTEFILYAHRHVGTRQRCPREDELDELVRYNTDGRTSKCRWTTQLEWMAAEQFSRFSIHSGCFELCRRQL